MFAVISLFYFSRIIFKKKLLFQRRTHPSQKAVTVKEELRGVDIDDIGNLEDSPRLAFIDEERGDSSIVAYDGLFTKGNRKAFRNR